MTYFRTLLFSGIVGSAGGSLGPEAPLVQINGSVGSWIAEQAKDDG
ncbi:MAG: hypothetical protein ABG776_22695 [Cyanobacteria bacterium J06555_13]